MVDAAAPLIASNRACVEKCINALKSTLEELDANNSLESDPRHQVSQIKRGYNRSIGHGGCSYPTFMFYLQLCSPKSMT